MNFTIQKEYKSIKVLISRNLNYKNLLNFGRLLFPELRLDKRETQRRRNRKNKNNSNPEELLCLLKKFNPFTVHEVTD